MKRHILIYVLYILEIKPNRQFRPACDEDPEMHGAYSPRLREEVDDEFDVVVAVAFVESIDHHCDCRIAGIRIDSAEWLQNGLLGLLPEGLPGDGRGGIDSFFDEL